MRPTSASCEIFSFDHFDPLADVTSLADHAEMIPIKGSSLKRRTTIPKQRETTSIVKGGATASSRVVKKYPSTIEW